MAIKHVVTSRNVATPDMTMAKFKAWLKSFDVDGDGRISQEELRRAISVQGGRFSGWRSKREMKRCDADGNGYIDADEVENMVAFAQKYLGIKIKP